MTENRRVYKYANARKHSRIFSIASVFYKAQITFDLIKTSLNLKKTKKWLSLPSETIDFVPSHLDLADKFSDGSDYEEDIKLTKLKLRMMNHRNDISNIKIKLKITGGGFGHTPTLTR